jgi:hypothetical protein
MTRKFKTTDYYYSVEEIQSGFDGKTCWVHARGCAGPPSQAVITTQKLRLTGSDVFYPLHSMSSDDNGRTWSKPVEQKAFGPVFQTDGSYFFISDFWPVFHKNTNTVFGVGHAVLYKDDELVYEPYKARPVYSIYNLQTKEWAKWKWLDLPEDREYYYWSGTGSTQIFEKPDGDILLPITYCPEETCHTHSGVAVALCSFDGSSLTYKREGNRQTVSGPRGLGEPSIAYSGGRYFMTMRNDSKAYVAASEDGLHFAEARPWTFEDGGELGSYNTQQHWISHKEKLYLVYTRKGLNNDHVFRHRAPLLMAEVDKDKLLVMRDTEEIMVPERGARLGNFGIAEVSENEKWIIVSEWMQDCSGTPDDCVRHGANNAIYICRICFDKYNGKI